MTARSRPGARLGAAGGQRRAQPRRPGGKEEIYARWLGRRGRDPDWPFERGEDFEDRHYRTAVATVLIRQRRS